jgi:hypothetical protein
MKSAMRLILLICTLHLTLVLCLPVREWPIHDPNPRPPIERFAPTKETLSIGERISQYFDRFRTMIAAEISAGDRLKNLNQDLDALESDIAKNNQLQQEQSLRSSPHGGSPQNDASLQKLNLRLRALEQAKMSVQEEISTVTRRLQDKDVVAGIPSFWKKVKTSLQMEFLQRKWSTMKQSALLTKARSLHLGK